MQLSDKHYWHALGNIKRLPNHLRCFQNLSVEVKVEKYSN